MNKTASQGAFAEFGHIKPVTSNSTAEDDAKLIYGVVFSLRNMTRKLTDEDAFICYKTSKYKLHFFETPTNIRFVLMSDPNMESQLIVLKQIYVSLYVEYVIKKYVTIYFLSFYAEKAISNSNFFSPLHPVDTTSSPMLDNELFILGVESFLSSLPGFD